MSNCRFCGDQLKHTFTNLGMSPVANSNIRPDKLHDMEPFYPLHAYVCQSCFLVQLEEFQSPSEIFGDYDYFSSFSASWLKHAEIYVNDMVERYEYNGESQIIEIASNDGYLLKNFVNQGIPVLGIEPAKNVAKVAQDAGIPTISKFFGVQTAKEIEAEGKLADLVIGNNVLAHVPDLNDFVSGLKIILKPDGIITMEFPHLERLMEENQFDTIYHEHFSYFSFYAVEKVFAHHGLRIFNVDELSTHGGSLRIYACHQENNQRPNEVVIDQLREREINGGINVLDTYTRFEEQVRETKRRLLEFLITAKRDGKSIVGYGAPAKGNTLLNYCGIGCDFIDYTVDLSPHKQDLYLPGTHIPIHAPEKINETKPDYVLILPWNLKDEIIQQMADIRSWGGQFIVPIPEVAICK